MISDTISLIIYSAGCKVFAIPSFNIGSLIVFQSPLLVIIIIIVIIAVVTIIIITRPRSAFGQVGQGGSSGWFSNLARLSGPMSLYYRSYLVGCKFVTCISSNFSHLRTLVGPVVDPKKSPSRSYVWWCSSRRSTGWRRKWEVQLQRRPRFLHSNVGALTIIQ